jgi:hypothetical protein
MAHTLHANNSVFNRHQDSLLTSLAHRLEVARATHNAQLIALLEREKQQIVPPDTRPQAFSNWVQTFTKWINQAICGSELQVSQFENGSDRWWYARDPGTGRCVYAESEAELRLWIKENYQGK